jgi:hypothetical protein
MTDAPAPAPAPTTAAEATARLDQIRSGSDPKFTEAFLAGHPERVREFHDWHSLAASGTDDIGTAMSGILPASSSSDQRLMVVTAEMLKGIGFTPLSIRETLEGRPATQAEVDLARQWKSDHYSNPDWVKKLMAGDVEAHRQMLTANVILNSPVKTEKV